MASSDDECEPVPQAISNYHFVDDADEPISFSKLPVQWNEVEHLDGWKRQIFLHGTADGGLQKVYKQVTAWKFDLSGVKPEISVLSKDMNWINLQKPRKSFIDLIRSSLITVHCLHILRKKPETSGRTLWDHLSKDFRSPFSYSYLFIYKLSFVISTPFHSFMHFVACMRSNLLRMICCITRI